MHNDDVTGLDLFVWFVMSVFGFIAGIVVASNIIEDRYKEGQIDALTGTVHYELVTQPDSSRVWERVDE